MDVFYLIITTRSTDCLLRRSANQYTAVLALDLSYAIGSAHTCLRASPNRSLLPTYVGSPEILGQFLLPILVGVSTFFSFLTLRRRKHLTFMRPHWPIRLALLPRPRRVTALRPSHFTLASTTTTISSTTSPKPSTTTPRFLNTMSTAPESANPTSPPAKRVKTDSTAATMDAAPPLLIKKLSDKARLPTRGSAFAAGYDVYAARDTTVPARGKVLVDTDISIAVPAGTCKCS